MSDRKYDCSGRDSIFADYQIPEWFDANGIDESWINDAMPSFSVAGYRVFVDSADPALSEFSGWRITGENRRFAVFRPVDAEEFNELEDSSAYETDDLAALIEWLTQNPAVCRVDR